MESPPALHHGRLFFRTSSSPPDVFGINPDTGEERSTFETDLTVDSGPVVDGDRLFLGCRDNTLRAVTAEQGDEIWKFTLEGDIGSPRMHTTVDTDTLFVAEREGMVYALEKETGKKRWQAKTSGDIWHPPRVDGDTVFVSSESGTLYAVEKATGDLAWEFDLGSTGTRPFLSDGTLVVGGDSGSSRQQTEPRGVLYAVDVGPTTDDEDSEPASDDTGAGLGVVSAFAGLCGTYLLKRQSATDSD
jgi:outer membrane protein assembly factor BamB